MSKFKGLASLLAKVLESRESGLLKNILAGAGLTFGSTIAVTSVINAYISKIKSDINSIPADILALMSMSNMDYAFSVILSAVVARATMNSMGIFLKKKG